MINPYSVVQSGRTRNWIEPIESIQTPYSNVGAGNPYFKGAPNTSPTPLQYSANNPGGVPITGPNPTQIGPDWTKVRDSTGYSLYRDPSGRQWIVNPNGTIEPDAMVGLAGSNVTTGPVDTSGPVSESQPYSPRWIDTGIDIPGWGRFQIPTFNASDLYWSSTGLPEGFQETVYDDFGNPVSMVTKGDTGNILSYIDPNSPYYLVSGEGGTTVQGRSVPYLGPTMMWANNVNRDLYSWVGQADPTSPNVNFVTDPNNPNQFSLRIKTADKEGTEVPYILQGNEWVPDINNISRGYWNTNNDWRPLVRGIAALAALYGGANLIGLGGAGEAAAGTPWEEFGLFGSETGAIGGESIGDLIGIPELGDPPIPPTEGSIGDMIGIPGLEDPPIVGSPDIPSPTIPSLGGLEDIVSRIGRGVNAIENLIGNRGGTQVPGRNATGLAGLLAALYGQKMNAAYADRLYDLANQMRQQADPYFKMLQESYTNPNSYLQSPEMQAILNLEANKLAGIDAAQGRLSNDFGRTAKLQQLAQARLGDYRRGLREAIASAYKPEAIAELFRPAAFAESRRYGDLLNWFGGGGSARDVWNDIKDIIDVGGDIWDVISGWFD